MLAPHGVTPPKVSLPGGWPVSSNGPGGKISTPAANAGPGLYPLAGQGKEHLLVVVGEGRIAGFVTRMDLVPSFRHGRTVFTERQESAIP